MHAFDIMRIGPIIDVNSRYSTSIALEVPRRAYSTEGRCIMAKKAGGALSFEQLLAASGGDIDTGELEKEKLAKQEALAKLEQEVARIKGEIKDLDGKLLEPVKRAVAAAKSLNMEVPAKYTNIRVNPGRISGNGNGAGSGLRFEFGSNGRVPVAYSLSEGAWYYTSECGGSNKQGRFTAEELRTYIEQETGTNPTDMKLQDKVTFSLPNEKEYTMQRVQ